MTVVSVEKIKFANNPRGMHARDVADRFVGVFPVGVSRFSESEDALFDVNPDGMRVEVLGDDRINFAVVSGSVSVGDHGGLVSHNPWVREVLYPALLELQGDSVINSVRVRLDSPCGSAVVYYASNKVLYVANVRGERMFPCSAREVSFLAG